MQGVRGEHKLPGEFRRSQNWIGGATINDALFVPPVHSSVGELMSDLEKFIHNDEVLLPELIKIAIIHYQFETIHPFLDGNGRIGRLLITLYLVSKNILKQPILYLSDYFERNRQLYYDNLMNARLKGDINQWIRFFLVGIIETAKNSISTFEKILSLKSETESRILALGTRSGNAQKVLEYLYKRPIIDATTIAGVTSLSLPSAYTLLSDFERLGILIEASGAKRNRYFIFEDYIQLYR